MPKMDGFEATQRIRQLALTNEQYRWCGTVPIVAMTAHSLETYEAACLEVGMNAQITKPITIEILSTVLQRWLPHVSPTQLSPAGILPHPSVTCDLLIPKPRSSSLPQPENQPKNQPDNQSGNQLDNQSGNQSDNQPGNRSIPTPAASPSDIPVFPGLCIQTGLRQMGGDWEGYGELLQLFSATYRVLDQELETAIDQGDYTQAQSILHRLRGAAGNIGAEGLIQAARNLESELTVAMPVADRIASQFPRILREFNQVIESIDAIMDYINSRADSSNSSN
jgi:HPt (histidine-containing phosphotransfer) domain-containing protein